MRAALAVLLAVGGTAGQSCPAPSEVAAVYLGSTLPSEPIHRASDAAGNVQHAEWPWMPSEGATLRPFDAARTTLRCGHYYGWDCRRVGNGTMITVDCKTDVCDAYVFLYHEPPRSSNSNGRLPLTLLGSDWRASSCAPDFTVVSPGLLAAGQGTATPADAGAPPDPEQPPQRTSCSMTAFRKQLSRDSATSFAVDGAMDAYYVVLAVAPGARCDSNTRQTSKGLCEEVPAFGNAQCRWVPHDEAPLGRAAGALQSQPTSSPTASPASGDGRCEDDYCPRTHVSFPRAPLAACSAPLTEPLC
eukprot:TRINITY_DN8623_c0_g2_i2.p1 TRINITY_DN8623_c0_g2~~TRINITY_DN8623_c0_g2_i2.p1  ORF type:complete len:326 (+),score=79.77 TRINITY_DN8623_c0_g2_i2:75-980(+)